MSSINLPWESEHIVEFSPSQLVIGSATTSVITTLISSLKNPTEFALIVTVDETKPAEAPAAQQGFMAKMKSMANNAATQAVKMQRQATAGCNTLGSVYDVKLVLPVAKNVDFAVSAGALIVSWTELAASKGEPVKKQVRLNGLSNKFVNVFNASKEISIGKLAREFVANGTTGVFSWLWKYQPTVPLSSLDEAPAPPAKPASVSNKVVCLTWNVAGLSPPDDNPANVLPNAFTKYKTAFIAFMKKHDPEVLILALQEASPLNAKTVLFKSSEDNYGEAWMEWFSDVLSCSIPRGKAEWIKTVGIVQVGLAVAMFVKNTETDGPRVTAPMTSCVKTGTLGLTGNKGCVGIRSRVRFASGVQVGIAALNVHLASGEGKADFRRGELHKVVNESSFGEDKSIHFFDSEFTIVTGDLNSRVNEDVEVDGSAIPTDDELLTRMRDEGDGFQFSENEVTFPATYKLVPNEEGRLVFAMNRRPGWCDRVLFRSALPTEGGDAKFHCLEYSSLRDIDLSDHTPVYAVFGLGVSPNGAGDRQAAPAVAAEPEFNIKDNSDNDEDDNDSDLYDDNK